MVIKSNSHISYYYQKYMNGTSSECWGHSQTKVRSKSYLTLPYFTGAASRLKVYATKARVKIR